ncbi:Rha family transcriptional regulator [Methylobacterium tarhaniae]|uniref:Rha family transcriptional regulator n=1 Tax=Methylobacterium tarhaniae TaxID=1187852 RepID=UPI003D05BD08
MTTTNLPIYLDDTGTARTDSRSLAVLYGKEHRNVLRDVDTLIAGCSDLRGLMFQEVRAFDQAASRVVRSFTMIRDGYPLLAMGWTGRETLKFKLAFLRRFNQLEAESRERHANPSSGSRDDALIAALTAQTQMATSLMQVMQGLFQEQQQTSVRC